MSQSMHYELQLANISYPSFYAMFQKGSHLQPIHDAGLAARTKYFENMSRAMALTCTGNIYVMSDKPADFVSGKASGGIWYDRNSIDV